MKYVMHDLMGEEQTLQSKKQRKSSKHIDGYKNIQFIPHMEEKVHLRRLVSQSKKNRDRSKWKSIEIIARECIQRTLGRGDNLVNNLKPSPHYLTKGRKINVQLPVDQWERISDLADTYDTSIKRMAYTFFNFGIVLHKEEDEYGIFPTEADSEGTEDYQTGQGVLL